MDQFGIPEKRVVSHDGTGIAYWIARPDPARDTGLALVFNNGIGIHRIVWQDLVAALRDRFTIVFWDYRCFYSSDTPKDPTHLRLHDHALDLTAILEAEGLRRVVLVGWSMGVQVSLEAWTCAADRIAGMVLLNGTSGRTFDTAFGMPGLIYWVPPVTRFLSTRYGRILNRSFPLFFRAETTRFLKVTGIVGPTIDTELLGRILDEYGRHDFSTYFHLLNSLGYHAPEHLEAIQAPVLVLVGGRDHFTPPLAGKRLRARLPNAELHRIVEGTHYMLMEYPALIRARLEQFLEQRVLRGASGSGTARLREASSPPPAAASSGESQAKAPGSNGIETGETSSPRERRTRDKERRSLHQVLRRVVRRPPAR